MFVNIKEQFGKFIQPALNKQILGIVDPQSVADANVFLLSPDFIALVTT
jgi:hypothetical protein